jgi:hypothetical protein
MTTAPWGCAACRANPLLCTQEEHARVCAGHPPNGPVDGPVGGTVGGTGEAAEAVLTGSTAGSIAGAAENMNNTAWTRATIQESLDEFKKTICLTLDSTIMVTNATRGKLTTGKLTTGKLTTGQELFSDKPVFLKALQLSSQQCKSIDHLSPVFIVDLLKRVTFLVGISNQINPEVLVYLKQLKEMAETVVSLMRKLNSLKKSGGGKRTRKSMGGKRSRKHH